MKKGVWHDHEAGEGGGVLDLLRREKGLTNGAAIEYLHDRSFETCAGPEANPNRRMVATYPYHHKDGKLLYEVVRFHPKDFRQRRPDRLSPDGWAWNRGTVQRVLYRLPQLLEAAEGAVVLVVEGEKDVDRLTSLGLIATTSPQGAGNWRDDYADALRHSRVVVVPHHDEPGRKHAAAVVESCHKRGIPVAVLRLERLPPKGDVSDWLDAGGTAEELLRLAEAALDAPQEELATEALPRVLPFMLADWTAARYWGEPPPIRWLIDGVLPLSVPGMVAVMGDTGKSFLLQELAVTIASGSDKWPLPIFGGEIVVCGGRLRSGRPRRARRRTSAATSAGSTRRTRSCRAVSSRRTGQRGARCEPTRAGRTDCSATSHCRSAVVRVTRSSPRLCPKLRAAAAGSPFTHTGAAGVFARRERLPVFLRVLSRHGLEALVRIALNERRVLKCVGPNSTAPRF